MTGRAVRGWAFAILALAGMAGFVASVARGSVPPRPARAAVAPSGQTATPAPAVTPPPAQASTETAEPASATPTDGASQAATGVAPAEERAGRADPRADATGAKAAEPDRRRRVVVSLEARRLWVVEGEDTLLRAVVAVGMGENFTYGGRTYRFETPRGTRTIRAKTKDPVWIVPAWHYYERAARMGLDEVVRLEPGDRILLRDSSWLVVRDDQVGRINHFGHFSPFTPGTEIIYDGRIYIPPLNTAQRRVPEALGPYKLDMGDGYLIHGTHPYNQETIGQAASHGCVRMTNADLERLVQLVGRGTEVTIR